MSQAQLNNKEGFPQDEALRSQVKGRYRLGALWRTVFLLATVLAIVFLLVLLINIINQSFGLVAVQNEIPPDSIVNDYVVAQLLSADNLVASEDDRALVQGIGSNINATGFLGYAYFDQNRDTLKALSIEGVEPNGETASSGEYPLTRPLFLYTTEAILAEQPQVAAFLEYYLNNIDRAVGAVGYFPADEESMDKARAALAKAQQINELPEINPADFSGTIVGAGSSTVFPVTKLMAEGFKAEGFADNIEVTGTGTGGGFNLFCVENLPDISFINASRPANQLEREACRANDKELLELQIGTDALAVVVNSQNEAVNKVTMEELQKIFTTSTSWSDVNPNWPAANIQRFVPTQFSGTMDFFIEKVFAFDLEELPKEALVAVLEDNVSQGLGRRFEREQLFFEDRTVFEDPSLFNELCASEDPPAACLLPARTWEEVFQLVRDRVVVPKVVESWFLIDSILNRVEITLETQQKYPDAEMEFRTWLSPEFIISPQSSQPELAGVRTAVLGTLWVIALTMAFAFPFGVGAAIYLEEYADHTKGYNRLIQTNINNLSGVPSIIYGMLGLVVFVRALEPLTSGAIFGVVDDATTANGRTILSAGLTLGLLILPIIIISAQESIRSVPGSLRQASFALGATRWQTIWHHVLPNALPGILTGTIISMSRAIGETAPLVVVGASTFITADPTGPFSKFTVLPIQIFQWTTRPQGAFRNIAGAAIIVLLILLLALNATAVVLRNRATKELTL